METATATTEGAKTRLAPAALKAVIQHVSERREALTPESFTAAYAQWAKRQGVPLDVQYTNELAALDHAIRAFSDLLIGNPWLNGRFRALGLTARDGRVDPAVRTREAKRMLNEVLVGKPSVLFDAVRTVNDVRRIVREVLAEVQELAYHLNVSQQALEQALKRAEEVGSVDELRRELDVIAGTVARLNRSMLQGRERLVGSVREYRGAGQAVFGTPAPAIAARVEEAKRVAA